MNLTYEEKEKILSVVRSWSRDQLTQERLRTIQRSTGIPARSVEIMFWHYDTLSLFRETDQLVFKGGTCVQSWIPHDMQRASVDLDFNSQMGNPNAIMDLMERIKEKAGKEGRITNVRGIDFGSIEFRYEDKKSGTMTFSRRMPSRFNEMVRVGDDTIQGLDLRIQINYKNSWLPALHSIEKEPDFVILDREEPVSATKVKHSSREDLVADKILAICNVHGFGRERFKDIYDLGMLLRLDIDHEKVRKKLKLIANMAKARWEDFTKGAVETLSSFSERESEARGFSTMVGKGGREIISDWELFCLWVIEKIRSIMESQ